MFQDLNVTLADTDQFGHNRCYVLTNTFTQMVTIYLYQFQPDQKKKEPGGTKIIQSNDLFWLLLICLMDISTLW